MVLDIVSHQLQRHVLDVHHGVSISPRHTGVHAGWARAEFVNQYQCQLCRYNALSMNNAPKFDPQPGEVQLESLSSVSIHTILGDISVPSVAHAWTAAS